MQTHEPSTKIRKLPLRLIIPALVVATLAVAAYASLHVIVTEQGYQSVLVHQPILGAFEVTGEVLPPGRNLEFVTVTAIPYKQGFIDYSVYLNTPTTKEGLGMSMIASLQLKPSNIAKVVSDHGEFWFDDFVMPLLAKSADQVVVNWEYQVLRRSSGASRDLSAQLRQALISNFAMTRTDIEVSEFSVTRFDPYFSDQKDSRIGVGKRPYVSKY